MNIQAQESKWTGYIWRSDSSIPEVILNAEFDFDCVKDDDNPFIVEGELYNEARQLSVSIRYIDGKHIFREFSPDSLDDDSRKTEIVYTPERAFDAKGIKGLDFWQIWRAEEDPCCEDHEKKAMKVLRPAELVFRGFIIKESEQ